MMKRLFVLLVCLMAAAGMMTAAAGEEAFTLTAPNGAPAIAVATLAQADPDHFTFVAADTIAAEFSKEEADFIIAPVNAGAKLYKAGKSTYRLAAIVTWGNLVFASQKEGFTPEDMNGANVTLFGENTINAAVALYVLKEKGIEPASVEYLAGAANTQQLLMTDPDAIVLTAEPAVTAAKIKNDRISSYALTEELKTVAGQDGFAQAGLFVKAKTLEEHPEEVAAYLETIRSAADKAETEPETVAAAAVALEILPNEKVALAALPGCSIRYSDAAEAKEAVEFTAGIDMTQFGGELPADDFYYGAE